MTGTSAPSDAELAGPQAWVRLRRRIVGSPLGPRLWRWRERYRLRRFLSGRAQERAFNRALQRRHQAAVVADVVYRVLAGRPASIPEQAELRQRAAQGTTLMDLTHEVKAGTEGSRTIVHAIVPALRTYVEPFFDPETGESLLPRLVFLHFMKVGGTSLSDLFARWFGEERARVHLFADDIALTPAPVLANLRLIAGHIPFAALVLIPPPFTTVAVLRDPFSRTLSHYTNLRSADPLYRDLTLEQFVFDEGFAFSGNYQARHLAHNIDLASAWRSYSPTRCFAARGGEPTPYPLAALFDSGPVAMSDDELLQTAATNLAQLNIVGTTEQLDDVARQVATLFGRRPEPVARLNASLPIDPRDIDSRVRRQIELRTAVDRELYERATQRALEARI